MAPKTHVKGQSSLSKFFAGASNVPLEHKKDKKEKEAKQPSGSASAADSPSKSTKRSASPEKSKKSKANSTGLERPEVQISNAPFTIKGRSSASASPTKPSSSSHSNHPSASPIQVAAESMSSSKPTSKSAGGSGGNAPSKSGGRPSAAIVIDDSDDDIPQAKAKVSKPVKRKVETDSEDTDFEAPAAKPKAATKKPKTSPVKKITTKGKKKADDDDDDGFIVSDDDEDEKPKEKSKKAAAPPKKAQGKAKAKEDNGDDKMEVDGENEKPKFNFAAALARKSNGPVAPGSKEIPVGQPNCLAGITLVFTGELESLSREESANLAKRYGARVTTSVSSKTTYAVVGGEPGPSKMASITKNKIATLDEDGFLDLIRNRGAGEIDEKTKKKMEEEKRKVIQTAKEFEQAASSSSTAPNLLGARGLAAATDPGALWTVKYAPRQLKDLVGNKGNVEKLREWLKAWPTSLASGFKKPGKHAMNHLRAVLISGPPGIGKTTTAHLVARLEGYNPIELNASDSRSKKLIEASMKDTINNSSLDGWHSTGKINTSLASSGVNITDRTVLIMDEVDGMSGGDRGGVGAINALIKKTRVPIICICNDRKNQKMKPFEHTTFNMNWRKPETPALKSRLLSIAHREGLKVPGEVMESLVNSAQSDMRSVINMLSTWALSQKTLNFDESKKLGDANQKPGMHTPFSLYQELSAAGMWAPTCKKNLNDKMDYYFQDFSIMPLMVQENYVKMRPRQAEAVIDPKRKELEAMKLISKAALSISDGDVIESMMRGSQQHWSLMPHHAIASVVRPVSFAYGMNPNGFPSFPAWLGKNSTANRINRSAVELQARMRLVTSGSRFAIRESYAPYLFKSLSDPLINNGADGIAEVVDIMDEYYLGLEDRDIIMELGIKPTGEEILKKIPSAVKSSFTRKYNAANHPIAFWKPVEKGQLKGVVAKGSEPKPDTEDAYEQDEEVVEEEEVLEEEDEDDIGKDKLVKEKKPKGKGKAPAKPKAVKK